MALIGSVNGIPVTKGGGDVATNTGVGTSALVSNTNGNNNSALGYQALDSCTSGFENVAMGSNAAAGITSGSRNTIIGNNAGSSLTTGNNNTIIGGNGTSGGAGESMTTGSRNTIIGGFTGNQNNVDIRSATNNIVLSDGDGNVGLWIQQYGATNYSTVYSGPSTGYNASAAPNTWHTITAIDFNAAPYTSGECFVVLYFTSHSVTYGYTGSLYIRIPNSGSNTTSIYNGIVARATDGTGTPGSYIPVTYATHVATTTLEWYAKLEITGGAKRLMVYTNQTQLSGVTPVMAVSVHRNIIV